ncbi:MAG TPA: phosphatase PAP2 family protein [Clostridiales bacterium]|nr:phosphatase PAP2 family protein [Clostridiales bacterium]
MNWEIDIIKALQNMSNAFFDALFLNITKLGEEIAFIAVMVVILWCYDKRFGLLMGLNFLAASFTVNILKNVIKRPRPFSSDAVTSIGARTHGYSFPSGHTQSATSIYTTLGIHFGVRKKRYWFLALMLLVVVLVGLSRIYLGQHYLTDVLTGFFIGAIFSVLVYILFSILKDKKEYWALIIIPIAIILMLIFNSEEAHKDFFVAGGVSISVAIGYFLEKRYIAYNVRQELWWVQILKVIFGAAIALLIKEGFKPLFEIWGFGLYLGSFIRYFLVGIWCSFGAMAVFKYGIGAIKKSINNKKYKQEQP